MKTVIIKSLLSIIAMLLLAPLNAQSLKNLSQAKRDSILISIAKKVLQKEAPEYLLEYGNLLFQNGQFILNLRRLKEKNLSLALITVLRMARFIILSNSLKMNL